MRRTIPVAFICIFILLSAFCLTGFIIRICVILMQSGDFWKKRYGTKRTNTLPEALSIFEKDPLRTHEVRSGSYPVKDLCELMGVSRSGYYKHLRLEKEGNLHSEKLRYAIALVSETHRRHPSHGYRWVAAFIRRNTDYSFSDGLIYKAFRYLGITSETKHKKRSTPRKVKDKYPHFTCLTFGYL